MQTKERVDWMLDVFLHSIGPFCANEVGILWLKGGLFGSRLFDEDESSRYISRKGISISCN